MSPIWSQLHLIIQAHIAWQVQMGNKAKKELTDAKLDFYKNRGNKLKINIWGRTFYTPVSTAGRSKQGQNITLQKLVKPFLPVFMQLF